LPPGIEVNKSLSSFRLLVPLDWCFQERPEILVSLCHVAIEELELIVRKFARKIERNFVL